MWLSSKTNPRRTRRYVKGFNMAKKGKLERLANAEAVLEYDRKMAIDEVLRFVDSHPNSESFWRVVITNTGSEDVPHLTGGIPVQPEDWEKADVIFVSIPDDIRKRITFR